MVHSSEPMEVEQDKTNGTLQTLDDDRSTISSTDTQQGVKGIEAISSTWSTSALVTAYVGYDIYLLLSHPLRPSFVSPETWVTALRTMRPPESFAFALGWHVKWYGFYHKLTR